MALLNEQGLNKLIQNMNNDVNSKVNATKDLVNGMVTDRLNGAFYISKPIIQANNSKYMINATVDGKLTCRAVSTGEVTDLVVESANKTLYRVGVSTEGELVTQVVTGVEPKDVYIQAVAPYGSVFKIGVLDDGTLITSPVFESKIIDDNSISNETGWSSVKVLETLNNAVLQLPTASSSKNGLLSKEDKSKINTITSINESISNITTNIDNMQSSINSINNTLSTKMDSSRVTISTSLPTGGKNGDIWIKYE